PGGVPFADLGRVELVGTFTPTGSGTHRLAVRSGGTAGTTRAVVRAASRRRVTLRGRAKVCGTGW
ncbi:hypothetical protein ABZ686_31550, partial [Streptomyces sp. NPDC006992]|uniref:hypothetical protein n=1 Tax=Streptomyces sp. NPDC006992 TaxID=3155601 RepID=UPI0033EF24DC